MSDLLFHLVAWPAVLVALLVFGFAPVTVTRLIVFAFSQNDPRRRELLGEVYHVPRLERPFWVCEQLERALFEGLGPRIMKAIKGYNSRGRIARELREAKHEILHDAQAFGLAQCGACGEAVQAYMGEDSPIYRCVNPACNDPVNRPATYIDRYVSELVFQYGAEISAAADEIRRSSPPPTNGIVRISVGLEEEWKFLSPSCRQAIIREMLEYIVIQPVIQPETREDFDGTVRHAWSWDNSEHIGALRPD